MVKITTQQFLEMDEIREGIIVLKNKALRGIIMVSSINFALKEEEEQNAIIYQFQDFLNSLDFSLEIIVQSRKLNITGYFDKLKELERKQDNEMLKAQIIEYQKFIREIVAKGSIMSKNFFIVVPFVLFAEASKKGFSKKSVSVPTFTEEKFQRAKIQLWQRMEFIALGLRRCGLQSAILNSSELIELFWSVHHPEQAEHGYYPEIPPEIVK